MITRLLRRFALARDKNLDRRQVKVLRRPIVTVLNRHEFVAAVIAQYAGRHVLGRVVAVALVVALTRCTIVLAHCRVLGRHVLARIVALVRRADVLTRRSAQGSDSFGYRR